jgi:hypothetical protein
MANLEYPDTAALVDTLCFTKRVKKYFNELSSRTLKGGCHPED